MDKETLQFVNRVKKRSKEIAETEIGIGGRREQEMIKMWRQRRPKMVKELETLGILAEFAHILQYNRMEADQQNITAGMSPGDASMTAEADWTMQEPETEDETRPQDMVDLSA